MFVLDAPEHVTKSNLCDIVDTQSNMVFPKQTSVAEISDDEISSIVKTKYGGRCRSERSTTLLRQSTAMSRYKFISHVITSVHRGSTVDVSASPNPERRLLK